MEVIINLLCLGAMSIMVAVVRAVAGDSLCVTALPGPGQRPSPGPAAS